MTTATKEVEVKERPIIFSAPMVKAILAGVKTQTRRVIKPQPSESWMRSEVTDWSQYYKPARFGLKKHLWICHPAENKELPCPYGAPGDRLWVRETFTEHAFSAGRNGGSLPERVVFKADNELHGAKWKSPLFLPRNASRITLEITNIRVERLQDISATDVKAEGIEPFLNKDATAWRAGFQIGWDEINAKRGFAWATNPWLWVIEFKKL